MSLDILLPILLGYTALGGPSRRLKNHFRFTANWQLMTIRCRAGCEAPACGILLSVRGGRKRPALRQMIANCKFAEMHSFVQTVLRGRPQVAPTANRERCECAEVRQSIQTVLHGRGKPLPYGYCCRASILSSFSPQASMAALPPTTQTPACFKSSSYSRLKRSRSSRVVCSISRRLRWRSSFVRPEK